MGDEAGSEEGFIAGVPLLVGGKGLVAKGFSGLPSKSTPRGASDSHKASFRDPGPSPECTAL